MYRKFEKKSDEFCKKIFANFVIFSKKKSEFCVFDERSEKV